VSGLPLIAWILRAEALTTFKLQYLNKISPQPVGNLTEILPEPLPSVGSYDQIRDFMDVECSDVALSLVDPKCTPKVAPTRDYDID
jgi:hypothetical protein